MIAAGTSPPHVFTVLINWNQPALTLACLASLASVSYSGRHTVVVVDNGSADDSVAQIRAAYPDVVTLSLPENIGYSPGNNVGIQYALEHGADAVFLLNNDTEVAPDVLDKLVAALLADPQAGMAGPTMFYFDPPDVVWGGENDIDWARGCLVRHGMGAPQAAEMRSAAPYRVSYIDSCALLVMRRTIDEIGLMDEGYFLNFDDADWNVRARRAGYELLYVPQAHIWHKVSASMGQGSPATHYYMTRNRLRFFWKHGRGGTRWLAIARILGRTGRTIAAWTFKRTYQTEAYRRRRAANLAAVRDFFRGRVGKMG